MPFVFSVPLWANSSWVHSLLSGCAGGAAFCALGALRAMICDSSARDSASTKRTKDVRLDARTSGAEPKLPTIPKGKSIPKTKLELLFRSFHQLNTPVGTAGFYQYEGELKGGVKHGKGSFVFADHGVYEGEWQDGKAHGHGKYKNEHCTYDGEWSMDMKHGRAVEEWYGTKYRGLFNNGKKHGSGRFEWPDGSFYEGEFCNDNIEGEGSFVWNDGREFKGQWKANKLHGNGRYDWPGGCVYIGQFSNDLQDGNGTFRWADGHQFTGQWKCGKQDGEGRLSTDRKCEWRDGTFVRWVAEEPNGRS